MVLFNGQPIPMPGSVTATGAVRGDDGKYYCVYHLDVEMYYVKMRAGHTFRCEECEAMTEEERRARHPSDDGFTSPEIKPLWVQGGDD